MRLRAREVGRPRDRYPRWLVELKAQSGAYVIRHGASGEVLYVGESHSGRLYQTITRHLQGWARLKRHWAGLLGSQQHDPGTTYAREAVTVEVITTAPGDAVRLQGRLIARLRPRDNIIGGDQVPF